MKQFDMKWVKYIGGAVGSVIAGIIIMFGGVKVVYPAISSLVGLAVAESASLWNNVRDASVGDNITNGILAQSLYLFDGTNFDRARGTGGSLNVTPIGSATPAEAFANPTTAITSWSLGGIFNGSTWGRWRGQVTGVQGPNLLNPAVVVSAANTATTQVIAGVAGQRIHIYKVSRLLCTPTGAANFNIMDGATVIFSVPNASVPTTPQYWEEQWPGAGLTGTTGNSMTLTVSACGASSTSNLMYQADQF